MKKALSRALLAATLAAAPSCHDDHGHGDHDHAEQEHDEHAAHDDHAEPGHDDHGHGHSDDGRPSEVITRWGARGQLFVEFPALVVGQESPFAAHLTRLSDHAAVTQGRVIVTLSGGGAPEERFEVTDPASPGIFRPVIKPAHAATRAVRLDIESKDLQESYAMGEFAVFASLDKVSARAEEGSEGEVSFLLEQQWVVPFGVLEAKGRPLRASVPAMGRFVTPPGASAEVLAPQDGRLEGSAAVGQVVREGEALFWLQISPQESADPASLALAWKQAQVRQAAARQELARVEPLVTAGALPARRLEEAKTALALADAEVQAASRRQGGLARSQQVGAGGERLALPSPRGGVLSEVRVAPGAWVTRGQAVARVVDREALWLEVGVPEAYVGRLKEVSGAWLRLEGEAAPLALGPDALVSVGVALDEETRTLPVRFRVKGGGGAVAGVGVQAHLLTEAPREALSIPAEAVVSDDGVPVVYVQRGGESFARRPVQLGLRDGDWVEVRGGLREGEWVVSRGAWLVKLASLPSAAMDHGHAH
jgi:cobalt-zinc-cadmium efflux system membrane fusion protein